MSMDQTLLGGGIPRNTPEPEEQSDFDFREILNLLRRHWLMILAAAVVGMGWGAVQYVNATEVFQASSQVLIHRRVPNPLGNQGLWLESVWNPEFYPTQYEILKGPALARDVVELLELWQAPQFERITERYLQSNSSGNTVEDDESLKQRLAAHIQSGVSIRPVRGTSLVDIIYRSNDPEVAAMLATGYADAFVADGNNDQQQSVRSLTERFTQEIDELERMIQEDQEKLLELMDSTNLIGSGSSGDVDDQRLVSLTGRLAEAQQRLSVARSEYNQRRTQPNPEIVAQLYAPSEVSAARQTLDDLQADFRAKSPRYQPTAQVMVELQRNIDQARQKYETAIRSIADRAVKDAEAEMRRAASEEASIRQQVSRVRGELRDSQADMSSADNLRQRIQAQEDTLADLRSNEQRVRVASNSGAAREVVYPAAVPGAPISPNLRNELSKGVSLGLFLGCALVLLIELLDRSIKTPEDLEKRLGLPVLAVIPDVSAKKARYGYGYGYGYVYGDRRSSKKNSSSKGRNKEDVSIDLLPHRRPRLATSEAYRGLRTSLLLSSAEELKAVAITSAFASEGKTATALNLAVVLAQLGKKTLLVDGDLRKARVHEVLKVSNRAGLVNYLVGAQTIDKVVSTTELENLFAAPAGPSPPNPSELLASTRMQHFLEEARRAFDFVVVDTPPALIVTDATILGSMVDGLVLTSRAGRVTRDDLRACKTRLQMGGVRILGAVLNCHRPHGGRRKQRYSAYSYETYGHDQDLGEDAKGRRGEVA